MRLVLAPLVAALAGCSSYPDAVDPWEPSARRDIGLPVLGFLWKKVVHDRSLDHKPQEFASAAVREDPATVYVGSLGRDFYALRATDGGEIWRQPLGAVSTRPVVDRGRVYVGTDDGALLALDTHDGSVRWRYETKGAILESPVLTSDLVLFATDADHVVALERATGKWRWQYDRETPDEFTLRGHSGLAIDGERVYVGFADGYVVALTLGGGDVIWVRSLAGESRQFVDVDTTPAVKAGVVYAASSSGGLYALDAEDGTEKWRLPIEGASAVSIDGDRIYVAAADKGLHALDLGGHVLWRQGLYRAGDPGRPLVHGDYLILTTSELGLFVVEKRTGELLESFDPGSGFSAEPTIAGDRMYVMSNRGILYAMRLREF